MEVYISELFLNKATSFPKELSANVGQTKGNGAFVWGPFAAAERLFWATQTKPTGVISSLLVFVFSWNLLRRKITTKRILSG